MNRNALLLGGLLAFAGMLATSSTASAQFYGGFQQSSFHHSGFYNSGFVNPGFVAPVYVPPATNNLAPGFYTSPAFRPTYVNPGFGYGYVRPVNYGYSNFRYSNYGYSGFGNGFGHPGFGHPGYGFNRGGVGVGFGIVIR